MIDYHIFIAIGSLKYQMAKSKAPINGTFDRMWLFQT